MLKGPVLSVMNISNQAIQFLVYLNVVRTIEFSQIGTASYTIALAGILSVIARCGGNEYLSKYDWNDKQAFKQQANLIATTTILNSLIITILFFALSVINKNLNIYSFYVVLMILICPLSSLFEQKMILSGEIKNLMLVSKLKLIINLNILFLSFLYQGISLLLIISIFNGCFFGFYNYKNIITSSASLKKAMSNYIYDIKLMTPYFLSSIIYIAPITFDKIYIEKYIGSVQLGVYDVTWKLALLYEIAVFSPITYLCLNKYFYKINIKRYIILLAVPFICIIFGFYINSSVIKFISLYFIKFKDIKIELLINFIIYMGINFINNIIKLNINKYNKQSVINYIFTFSIIILLLIVNYIYKIDIIIISYILVSSQIIYLIINTIYLFRYNKDIYVWN